MSLYDENAEVLRGFEDEGSDLTPARVVDFSYIFSDHEAAERFAAEAESLGFDTEVNMFDEDILEEYAATPWDARASRVMVPNCENITSTEIQLNELAGKGGGLPDGWGFFRV